LLLIKIPSELVAVALPHRGEQSAETLVAAAATDIRAFGLAVVDLDLTDTQMRMIAMPGQTNTRLAGRRVGKSVATLVRALWYLLTVPRSTWYATAPSLDQARLYFDEIGAAIERSSLLEAMLAKPPKYSPFPEVRFRNGSVLHGRSTARGGTYLRGKGAHGVIVTEAAFVPEQVYQAVIRAMVLDRGGQLELESTPNGVDNYTTHLFELGHDPDQARYRSLHATVYDNPRLDPAEIEAIRIELPDHVWRTEYLAEILDLEDIVFPWSVLEPVFDDYEPQRDDDGEPKGLLGHRYVGGLDLAQVSDFTADVVLDIHSMPWHLAHWDRFRGRMYTGEQGVVGIANRVGRAFRDMTWWVDTTMERSVGEQIENAMPFVFSETTRANLFAELQLAIEQRQVTLPAGWTVLRDELRGLRRLKRKQGLGWRIDHPFGGHDDTAIALALAVHGARARLGGSPGALDVLRRASFASSRPG
jgi:Terminase large subunit, T4likevirus-type, N-terminal